MKEWRSYSRPESLEPLAWYRALTIEPPPASQKLAMCLSHTIDRHDTTALAITSSNSHSTSPSGEVVM